jgi:hypothetical protein
MDARGIDARNFERRGVTRQAEARDHAPAGMAGQRRQRRDRRDALALAAPRTRRRELVAGRFERKPLTRPCDRLAVAVDEQQGEAAALRAFLVQHFVAQRVEGRQALLRIPRRLVHGPRALCSAPLEVAPQGRVAMPRAGLDVPGARSMVEQPAATQRSARKSEPDPHGEALAQRRAQQQHRPAACREKGQRPGRRQQDGRSGSQGKRELEAPGAHRNGGARARGVDHSIGMSTPWRRAKSHASP